MIKDIRTMDWSAYEVIQLTHQQFLDKLKSLEKNRRVRKKTPGRTKRSFWYQSEPGTWLFYAFRDAKVNSSVRFDLFADVDHPTLLKYKYARIQVHESNDKDGNYVFKVYQTNLKDDSHNTSESAGKLAYRAVVERMEKDPKIPSFVWQTDDKFKEPTLDKLFGQTPESFKQFIPRQFYYFNELYKDKLVKHASYADFCSMFPSCMLGKLPDANGYRVVDSEIEPSEEYPFAFYPNTCDLAEYNGFDTRKWNYYPDQTSFGLSYKLSNDWRTEAHAQGEKRTCTVLMPASSATMDSCWQYFYKKRRDPSTTKDEAADIKRTMNAFIGTLHKNSYDHMQAHVVAVVLARAGQKMLDLVKTLYRPRIIQIAIDGVIYEGAKAVGGNEKALTKLYQNYTDQPLFEHSINCYAWMDRTEEKVIECKHQGYNCDEQDNYIDDNWLPRYPEEMAYLKNDTQLQKLVDEIVQDDEATVQNYYTKAILDIKAGTKTMDDFFPYNQKKIKEAMNRYEHLTKN